MLEGARGVATTYKPKHHNTSKDKRFENTFRETDIATKRGALKPMFDAHKPTHLTHCEPISRNT